MPREYFSSRYFSKMRQSRTVPCRKLLFTAGVLTAENFLEEIAVTVPGCTWEEG